MSGNLRYHIHYVWEKCLNTICRFQMSFSPYADTINITSIDTGLRDKWKYSPLSRYPITDVDVVLTGSRRKDYRIAEQKANVVHTPGVTVWHHAWLKNNSGEYRMQLVNIDLHKKSCPHVGGCKMWSIEHGTPYKSQGNIFVSQKLQGSRIRGKHVISTGFIRRASTPEMYDDLVIDYIFEKSELKYLNPPLHKSLRRGRSRSLTPWGLDPYGNLFCSDQHGELYFLDHETSMLIDIRLSEGSILR